MAEIDKLLPFILYFEARIRKGDLSRPLPELFEIAKRTGYVNDPDDSGGATMCGVTIATYRAYRRGQGFQTTTVDDLKQISYIAWRAIVKSMYWDRWKADRIADQAVANMLVDWLWNSGAPAIKIPQRILGVESDGIVGAKTLTALNGSDPAALFNALQQARRDYVVDIAKRRPSRKKFLTGWLNRINALTYCGFVYA